MIKIESNGSKWLGQKPDTIEELLKVLKKFPLDPVFERYGNFIYPLDGPEGYEKAEDRKAAKGQIYFSGNFAGLSHVFGIATDDPAIIATLTKAIRENQASEQYKAIKKA